MFTLVIEDRHGRVADEYTFDGGEFFIGRRRQCDIILPSENVSRKHARLFTRRGRCHVEDLGSANGVFLHGRRIKGETPIGGSAQIKVGDFYLHIESSPSSTTLTDGLDYVRLHGRNLGAAGRTYRLTSRVNLVGRGRDCSVTIIDASVSRIHAKLTADVDGAIHVEDLKSANGTYLNDVAIEHGTLADNDVLRIGNVELRVEIGDPMSRTGVTSQHQPGIALSDIPEPPAPDRPGRVGPVTFWASVGALLLAFVPLGAVLLAAPEPHLPPTPPPEAAAPTPAEPPENSISDEEGPAEQEPADQEPASEGSATPEPTSAEKKSPTADSDAEEARSPTPPEGGDEREAAGATRLEERDWKAAISVYAELLAEAPLNEEHARLHNLALIELHNQTLLESARESRKARLYGDALESLHEVTENSAYRPEADAAIGEILTKKFDTIARARKQCNRRRLQACHDLFTDALALDPSDSLVKHQRELVAARLKR